MNRHTRRATGMPIRTESISFITANVCHGPAGGELETSDGTPVEQAAGVARIMVQGSPMIVVTLVDKGTQTTLTMDVSGSDTFCHLLAAAVEWQNRIVGLATQGRPH